MATKRSRVEVSGEPRFRFSARIVLCGEHPRGSGITAPSWSPLLISWALMVAVLKQPVPCVGRLCSCFSSVRRTLTICELVCPQNFCGWGFA